MKPSGAPASKAAVREMAWRAMEIQGVARFPGSKGRIPNFVGAELAALHLGALPEWRRARVVKINPDAPQLPVRRMALREGKIVYMAVPRLQGAECFVELDPARLGAKAVEAASIRGAERLGRRVPPEALPRIDLIGVGAVAVDARGARVGKGGGFSDLEYGLLAELGLVDGATLVVTTVHGVQLVPQALPMEPHDVPVDVIATPEGLTRLTATHPRPRGIYPAALTPEKVAEVPRLGRFREGR